MSDPATLPRTVLPLENITNEILLLRGQKVLIDASLAALCGVTTQRLNDQVNRNLDRFPPDFLFQATAAEFALVRPRIASLNSGRGRHRKSLPYVFTQYGALMASMILDSHRATEIALHVVRGFVNPDDKFAGLTPGHESVSQNTRVQLGQVFKVLRELVTPSAAPASHKK